MHPLRTKKSAIAYCYFLSSIDPARRFFYFKTPKSAQAASLGCVYGICNDLEKAEYEKIVELTEVIPIDLTKKLNP